MKKCSYCGRDNADEALNCHECGTEFEREVIVELKEESPPACFRIFRNQESAHIAASLLQAQGIHSWLNADDCGGMMPIIGGGGVKFFVNSEDAEKAKIILDSQNLETPSTEKTGSIISPEEIVPDRPKLIIVAGIWAIYGTGLIANILLLICTLNGTFVGIQGLIYFWLSIGCGALCTYLLYRAVKNYQIQSRRMEKEKDSG